MPFPKAPHPDLRQWDDRCCDTAIVAQLLYMGGQLEYPFDTAAFDRTVRRQPGQPAYTMDGIRLIARRLPVTLTAYSPEPIENYVDPTKARAGLRRLGYSNPAITAYLKSAAYQQTLRRNQDILRLDEELGSRGRRIICTNAGRYARRHLNRGEVLATAVKTSAKFLSHSVLLVPRRRTADADVTLYDPVWGVSEEKLSFLVNSGQLELDEGFSAYNLP